MMSFQLGIDNLSANFSTQSKKIGLLVHQASVNSDFIHLVDLIQSHFKLTKLFGPEHGVWGIAQDMEGVSSGIDPYSKLPVKSLYGNNFESLEPSQADLDEIDVLICDLQDIGARYYTYAYTIAFCMKACAKAHKQMIVLDRPNPINGINVEGKILQKGFESFVGMYPLPIRHGMTMGELALFFKDQEKLDVDLQIVKMEGWERGKMFDETGAPWIHPSPNMPSLNTAIVYPGMCFLEATEISEGRGTTKPFEIFGAPFIDAKELTDQLKNLKLDGIDFSPIVFRPQFQKWAGMSCKGAQIHVTDRKKYKPVLSGLAILKTLFDMYPNDFKWREKAYEFVKDIPAIDLLTGDASFRKHLENKSPHNEILEEWKNVDEAFLELRKKYLLY